MNIQEIARLCNVSTATISRVLNNHPNVREQTRQHVLAAMEKYGYIPNAFARGLGLNSMRMIGILCTNIEDAYYAKAVSLVESKLREHGFDILLCSTGSKLENKKKYLALLLEKRVDAVVLVGSAFREEKDNSHLRTAAKQVPIVIINGLISIPGLYCVICDEKEAMSTNVHLLAQQGYRNILYLYDELTYSGSQKLAGYREALNACGIRERKEHFIKPDKDLGNIQAAVEEILQKIPEIDAVLTSEDLLAVGAQKAFSALNKALPLIGFDNTRYAQCATPALTSVDNMLDTICPTTVSLLLDLLDNREAPPKIVVSAKLIERDTFRLAPKDGKASSPITPSPAT